MPKSVLFGRLVVALENARIPFELWRSEGKVREGVGVLLLHSEEGDELMLVVDRGEATMDVFDADYNYKGYARMGRSVREVMQKLKFKTWRLEEDDDAGR